MTVGVEDIQVPLAKKQILIDSDAQVIDVEKQYRRGLITEEERYQEIVEDLAVGNQADHRGGQEQSEPARPGDDDGQLGGAW